MMATMPNLPSRNEPQAQPLTQVQEVGAILAAAGYEGAPLAAEAGVKLSVVRAWQRNPAWIERRNQLILDHYAANGAKAQRVIGHIWDAQMEAVEYLRDALKAEDDEGRPLHGVRSNAAELLLKRPVKDTMSEVAIATAKAKAEDDKGKPVTTGALHITVNTGGADGTTTVESDATEVVAEELPPGPRPAV